MIEYRITKPPVLQHRIAWVKQSWQQEQWEPFTGDSALLYKNPNVFLKTFDPLPDRFLIAGPDLMHYPSWAYFSNGFDIVLWRRTEKYDRKWDSKKQRYIRVQRKTYKAQHESYRRGLVTPDNIFEPLKDDLFIWWEHYLNYPYGKKVKTPTGWQMTTGPRRGQTVFDYLMDGRDFADRHLVLERLQKYRPDLVPSK